MKLINIFGAPGTGKSTTSAGIFHNLKLKGIDVEYVQEYAKDKTWQGDFETLRCQPYVTGKQLFRLHRLKNKVDYVVTDAPIINGLLYQDEYTTPSWNTWLAQTFKSFRPQLNIFLEPDRDFRAYNPNGRSQTEQEADLVGQNTLRWLASANVNFTCIKVTENYMDEIMKLVLEDKNYV